VVGGTIVYENIVCNISDSAETKTVYTSSLGDELAAEVCIPAKFSHFGFERIVSGTGYKSFPENKTIVSMTSAMDVGFESFANCGALMFVTPGEVADLGKSVFRGYGDLSCIGPSYVEIIGDHSFCACDS